MPYRTPTYRSLFTEEEYAALLREIGEPATTRLPAPAPATATPNVGESQSDSSLASQSGSSDTSPARQSNSSGASQSDSSRASSPYEEWAAYRSPGPGLSSSSIGNFDSTRSWYTYETGGWFSGRVSSVSVEPVRRPQPEHQNIRTLRWGYRVNETGHWVEVRIPDTTALDPELWSTPRPVLGVGHFASLVDYIDRRRRLTGRDYVALHDQLALLMMPGPEVTEPERTIVIRRLNRLHVLGVLTMAEASEIWGRVLDRHLPSAHAFADANAPTEEEWWTLFCQVGERFSLRPPLPLDPAGGRARRAAPRELHGRAVPPTWPRAFSRLPRS